MYRYPQIAAWPRRAPADPKRLGSTNSPSVPLYRAVINSPNKAHFRPLSPCASMLHTAGAAMATANIALIVYDVYTELWIGVAIRTAMMRNTHASMISSVRV